jgi:hypothetical protein
MRKQLATVATPGVVACRTAFICKSVWPRRLNWLFGV